jgi:hypothetical protein
MGPITLFDKSFLQALSTDESVWFDNFFYPVIAPLFYIETLADLEKPPRPGKTAEEEVAIIARKTPQLSGGPCYFHHELCIQDLLGNHVPLTGQIPIAGMRQVVQGGRQGAVMEVSPEAKAFARWQRGRFLDVDRLHARLWRAHLNRIDLSAIEHAMKHAGINSKTCKTLQTALEIADTSILGLTKSPGRFDAMLEVLSIPFEARCPIKERWKLKRQPRLASFAPYAAHLLRVEIFFHAAIGANLIGSARATNRVDMAYLFYLPFCTLFVSSDHLHRACAPLFMRQDQEFVWGQDLKLDLTSVNSYYAALPHEIRLQGIYKFANHLPDESRGLIRSLFERHAPRLLKPERVLDPDKLNPEAHRKLVQHIKDWESSPDNHSDALGSDGELDSLILKRSVSRKRGSWVQVGPEID